MAVESFTVKKKGSLLLVQFWNSLQAVGTGATVTSAWVNVNGYAPRKILVTRGAGGGSLDVRFEESAADPDLLLTDDTEVFPIRGHAATGGSRYGVTGLVNNQNVSSPFARADANTAAYGATPHLPMDRLRCLLVETTGGSGNTVVDAYVQLVCEKLTHGMVA